ncbi:pilus assembly protein TadG-related protein [Desulfocucumis palustris]|uniref:pilus assembly protein TadG-related protein n=1 Tax=Desulfocucumis palustris TaxID=1898651 RepID=UPI000FFE41B6|nr:Tad domain-containing protein [Desulfocucumis palustris]
MVKVFKNMGKDQRGTVILMAVLLVSILLIMAGVATDLARAWVAREDLQAAIEAASLAGARNAKRYVTVTVEPGHKECSTDEDGHTSCWCVSEPIVDRSGNEVHMIDEDGWRHNECDNYLGIRKRWLEYPNDTAEIMQGVFDVNRPSLLEEDGEITSERIKINDSASDEAYPSVTVRAGGSVNTFLLKLAGIDELEFNRCSQSASYYDKIVEGKIYGWERPEDDCKE